MSWPPHSSDIKTENISVPNAAYNLLAWVLSDEDRTVEDNEVKAGIEEQCHRFALLKTFCIMYQKEGTKPLNMLAYL